MEKSEVNPLKLRIVRVVPWPETTNEAPTPSSAALTSVPSAET